MSLVLTLIAKFFSELFFKVLLVWWARISGKREAHREVQAENYKRRAEADEWRHQRLDDLRRDHADPTTRFRVRDNPGRIRLEGDSAGRADPPGSADNR